MSENMKPSGIKWIKDIPSSWNIIKVKHLATDKNSLFLDGDWIESDVIEESGIRYLTTGNVGVGYYKEQGSGYISEKTFRDLHCLKVLPYDLMVSRLNEPIGRACIVPNNESFYVVAVDNVIIRPNKNFNKRFLMYVMNTDGYAENGNIIARGATMSRVSRSQLGQFWISYPELSEQTLIANFLDEQCKKIDSIVTDIENQIEILQKYKKSLITEAVTKGLDKSVSMKDSGIEWIGDIPEHWDIKKLKYVSRLKTGTTPSGNEGINYDNEGLCWFTPGDFNPNMKLTSSEKYIDEQAIKLENITVYPKNSVLLVAIGATVGKIGYTFEDSYSNQQITAIIPNDILGKYLLYYISSNSEYIKENALYTTLPIINNSYLGSIYIVVPSENEQALIANHLDERCTIIDLIIESKKGKLEKIGQHKKSLIYEYVTGKKRVKGESNNGN